MAKKSRWENISFEHGVKTVRLISWKYFSDFINLEMREYRDYIWRGQRRSSSWPLISSLQRMLQDAGSSVNSTRYDQQLSQFKMAIRGRRGPNPVEIHTPEDWWALGQHYGLASPLLDWTEAPFAGLFFAFEKMQKSTQEPRVVFGLAAATIESKSKELLAAHAQVHNTVGPTPPPPPPTVISIVRPQMDENARLVSQRGLFTSLPPRTNVENWIRQNFQNETEWILIKLEVPDIERSDCLTYLNRMNLNHLSLFPDLYGASQYSNMRLVISHY